MHESDRFHPALILAREEINRIENNLKQIELYFGLQSVFPIGMPDIVFILAAQEIEAECVESMRRLEPWISVIATSMFDQLARDEALVEDVVEGVVIEPSNPGSTGLYQHLNELIGRAREIYQPDLVEEFPPLASEETVNQALTYAKLLEEVFAHYKYSIEQIEALCELALEVANDTINRLEAILKGTEEIIAFFKKNGAEIEDGEESGARLKLLGESAAQYLAIVLRFKQMVEMLSGADATGGDHNSSGGDDPEPEENY